MAAICTAKPDLINIFAHFLLIFSFILLIRADQSKHVSMPTGTIDAFNNDVFALLTNAPVYNKYLPPQENRKHSYSVFWCALSNVYYL